MTETRMRRSLIRTFQQYTEIGVEWRKTVIALTFADSLQLPPNLKKKKEYSIIRYFNERLDEWRVEIPKTLASEIALEETTLARISINPTAGDYEDPLPNGEDWYIPFWLNVLDVLPPAARITLSIFTRTTLFMGTKKQERSLSGQGIWNSRHHRLYQKSQKETKKEEKNHRRKRRKAPAHLRSNHPCSQAHLHH